MAKGAGQGKDKAVEKAVKKLWEDAFKSILRQEWNKALSFLGQLDALEVDNPQVHLKIGDVLQRTGDRTGALAAYHKAALGLIDRGFRQKALAIYKVILRLEPNDGEALDKSKEIVDDLESEKAASPLGQAGGAAWRPGGGVGASIAVPDAAALPDEPFTSRAGDSDKPGAEEAPGRKIPWIFSSLTGEEFAELSNRAGHRTFKDGEPVVREGDIGGSMFTIEGGHARVATHIRGRLIELAVLSEGDFFGEVAFLTGRPRTASVAALGDLRVMDISREALRDVLGSHPLIMDSLVEFYYSRVKDTLTKARGG